MHQVRADSKLHRLNEESLVPDSVMGESGDPAGLLCAGAGQKFVGTDLAEGEGLRRPGLPLEPSYFILHSTACVGSSHTPELRIVHDIGHRHGPSDDVARDQPYEAFKW